MNGRLEKYTQSNTIISKDVDSLTSILCISRPFSFQEGMTVPCLYPYISSRQNVSPLSYKLTLEECEGKGKKLTIFTITVIIDRCNGLRNEESES